MFSTYLPHSILHILYSWFHSHRFTWPHVPWIHEWQLCVQVYVHMYVRHYRDLTECKRVSSCVAAKSAPYNADWFLVGISSFADLTRLLGCSYIVAAYWWVGSIMHTVQDVCTRLVHSSVVHSFIPGARPGDEASRYSDK